jgi:hypothetical protein
MAVRQLIAQRGLPADMVDAHLAPKVEDAEHMEMNVTVVQKDRKCKQQLHWDEVRTDTIRFSRSMRDPAELFRVWTRGSLAKVYRAAPKPADGGPAATLPGNELVHTGCASWDADAAGVLRGNDMARLALMQLLRTALHRAGGLNTVVESTLRLGRGGAELASSVSVSGIADGVEEGELEVPFQHFEQAVWKEVAHVMDELCGPMLQILGGNACKF